MDEAIKIPKDRIAVLIGEKGATKREIEGQAKVSLGVNSKTGEVTVKGSEKAPLKYYIATNIVKAIGRGFNPEYALLLLNDNYYLELMEIEDFAGKKESEQLAKKGRVIGKEGIVRKRLEEETGCFISVYGKTVGIIGHADDLELARKSVGMLLKGKSHDSVFSYIKKKKASEGFKEMRM